MPASVAIAVGTARFGDGSCEPIQSSSAWKRFDGPYSGLAPCDVTTGLGPDALAAATMNPDDFGAHSHLWLLPAYQVTPSFSSAPTSSASWPGPCAPSTMTGMSCAANAGTIRSSGNTSAVGLVM